MHILYIYDNERDKKYENYRDSLSLYCLNTGKLIGDRVSNINDHKFLNEIATNNVEPYSEFIYTQNDKFIENKLLYKNKLSLYFLTDFSCKRTEIFSTYSDYCNTLLLKNYLLM